MNTRQMPVAALTAMLAFAPFRVAAKDITMVFGTPLNTVPVQVEVKFRIPGTDAGFISIPAVIPPGVPASVKAQIIGTAVAGYGLQVDFFPPAITIKNLKPAVYIKFVDHGTAEDPDKLMFRTPPPLPALPDPGFGTMNYGIGHFDPSDPQGQPAVFTAGIVTDVGELSAQVTAAELNFQTDGPIICQALFQRLAPQAPQYGAQINYAGDRLEVYFDPAYTVTQGGIIFGNTSRQGDSGAGIIVPPNPTPPPVEFKFSLPLNPAAAQVMLDLNVANNAPVNLPVTINPGDSVLAKRDKIVDALSNAGAAPIPVAPDRCVVGGLAPGSMVRMTDLGTCEASDSIKSKGVTHVIAGFPGHFQPNAPNNQPAIFTAGIVTDVGTLSAQVSSAELNFQTDGPIICQALFQRLAPLAPQYGAQINYAGDRLEVNFDPAYTVAQGGIVFGTTSPTPGNYGTIILPPLAPTVLGDMNCDGVANGLDIAPFIMAITNPSGYAQAYPGCPAQIGDMNGDGFTNLLDVNPFVQLLAQ